MKSAASLRNKQWDGGLEQINVRVLLPLRIPRQFSQQTFRVCSGAGLANSGGGGGAAKLFTFGPGGEVTVINHIPLL